MKTKIQLPIDIDARLLVEVGDVIDEETPLAEYKKTQEEKILHLSKLLHVKSEKIGSYLRVKIGEKIIIGNLIAQKKGLFSTTDITSPIKGIVKEIDLARGTLTIETDSPQFSRKILSSVTGRVVGLAKGYLEVEVSGSLYKGHKGEGGVIFGDLVYLSGENIGTLELNRDVEEKIVVGHSFKEETLVKLEVMGAIGLVSLKPLKEVSFSFLQVDEETFLKIKGHTGKRAMLNPKEKEIIIFD